MCSPFVTKNRAGSAESFRRVIRIAAHRLVSRVFADMRLDAGYPKWIHAAYAAGPLPLYQTTPDLRFRPNDPFTRSFASYMMAQAKGPVEP